MYRMQPRAPQRAREQEWLEERGGHAAHDEEGGGAAQQRPHTSLDLNILRDQGRSQFEDLLPFSSGRRTGSKTPTLLWQQKQFLGCVPPLIRRSNISYHESATFGGRSGIPGTELT